MYTLNIGSALNVNCASQTKLLKSSDSSLLSVYRNTFEFYVSTLCPANLLNSLVLVILVIGTVIVAIMVKINSINKEII